MTRLKKLATIAAAVMLVAWVIGPGPAADQETAESKPTAAH